MYKVHIWAKKHLIVWIASGTTRTERCKGRNKIWNMQIIPHIFAYMPSFFLFSCQFRHSDTIYTWFFRILCQHGLYHIGSRWYLYPSIGIMSSFLCSYWGCMWCQCKSDSLIKFEVANADSFANSFQTDVQVLVEAFVVVVTWAEIEDGFGACIFLHERFDKRVDFYLDVGFIISSVFGLRPVVFDEASIPNWLILVFQSRRIISICLALLKSLIFLVRGEISDSNTLTCVLIRFSVLPLLILR